MIFAQTLCICRNGFVRPAGPRRKPGAFRVWIILRLFALRPQEEISMTKLALLGAAVIASCSMLAGPALAQHRAPQINTYNQVSRCTHDAGNPYSKEEDYMAWSGWRARGGWDDRPDPNCVPGRMNYTGF
jgi:hypothetical protein